MITRKSVKGQHYTVFCNATGMEFDKLKTQAKFIVQRQQPNLTTCQKENDHIVVISLQNIKQAIITNTNSVMDLDRQIQRVRDVNIPAYRWLFDYLKRDDNIFNC